MEILFTAVNSAVHNGVWKLDANTGECLRIVSTPHQDFRGLTQYSPHQFLSISNYGYIFIFNSMGTIREARKTEPLLPDNPFDIGEAIDPLNFPDYHGIMWQQAGRLLWTTRTGSDEIPVFKRVGQTWERQKSYALSTAKADRLHVNSVALDTNGTAHVTAFCEDFIPNPEWDFKTWRDAPRPEGCIYALGEDDHLLVGAGLSKPHTLTRYRYGWLVCDGQTGNLLHLDDEGQRQWAIECKPFLRGLHVLENPAPEPDTFLVGVSNIRHQDNEGNAAIWHVDDTGDAFFKWDLPVPEIFDVCVVER